jgi:hypothetical protein
VRLQDRRSRQILRLQVALQPLDVLGLQTVEPVVPDSGRELIC